MVMHQTLHRNILNRQAEYRGHQAGRPPIKGEFPHILSA